MSEFARGSGPLFAATIGTMCGLITITNYSQGFFVGPVITEFGWTPGQFFLGFTVMMCAGLITAPVIGSLAQKYGIRTIGMIGLVGHSIGYFLISLNPNSLPLWYASWALLAVLAAGSLPIIWTSVLNGWFVKNRGKAVGITMAGTGIGAFLLPPIVETIITGNGWRTAYQSIGIGALIISLPIVFLLFRENQAALSEDNSSSSSTWGMTRGEAMASAKFWILGAVLFLTVFVVVGLLSNFERIVSAKGIERSTIAAVATVIGVTVILGRLLVGALVDRFWAPGVASFFFTLPIVAILLLVHAPFSMTIGVIIAIFIGLAAGAELDLLAYLTSKYFGPKHYAKIFGGIFAFFTVGAGIAPPVFGEMAAATGSYTTPLYLAIAILSVCIVLFLMLGRYPDQALAEMESL
ncbi:MAG: MFS transporter [Pseudomonadota bacterium]